MDINYLYKLYKEHGQVTTDSRNCPKGSIFIALKGASFDGNKFAKSALEKGCSYAVVDEKEYYDPQDGRMILTDDCLTTYKELAREHRRQFHIPVIGITGTNGKTTTKELVSAVLAEKFKVMHTEANFNNDVGVPKTLLRLTSSDEIAVVEMGASHPGDIEKLVKYVEPTAGLITNVGRAHLQGFGSFEGVKKTKGELYDYLKEHDCEVFLNKANNDLIEMAKERGLTRCTGYGQGSEYQYDVTGRVLSCSPYLNFQWEAKTLKPDTDNITKSAQYTVKTHMIGNYNIDNMLAAITVGLRYGVPIADINHALESYIPSNDRSELKKTADNSLIIDAYNANPSSMAAAIDNFRHIDASQKMVILGDMRELGSVSADEHQKVVDSLGNLGIDDDHVWLVGSEFGKTVCHYRKFTDVAEVKAAIAADKPHGYTILIKGSNGIRLFELPDLL